MQDQDWDADRLRQSLSNIQSLPRPIVAPTLCYGRHRGPAPRDARIAAVAVALYQDTDRQWKIPLTLRPSSLHHHGGQVCLPGGQVEADEELYDAAMREFEEELGVAPMVTHRCGQLSAQYVYASDNLVHPIVTLIQRPRLPWRPDPVEVEQVIPLPVTVLLSDRSRTELAKTRQVRRGDRVVGTLDFRATAFRHQQHTIWGATALILDQLAQILQQRLPGERSLPKT